MDQSLITQILTIIGSLATAIVFVLKYYFKKAQELDDLKSSETSKAVDRLEKSNEMHVQTMKLYDARLQKAETKMDEAISKYSEFQEANKGVQIAVKNFVEASEKRFENIETQIVKLGKDVFMVTSKK